MQAIDALLTRHSARQLTEPAPDEAALALLLASAARAPDHGRLRPWRFVVLTGAGRERLGALLAGHLERIRPGATREALERERAKALRAPLILVVAAVVDEGSKVPALEQVLCAGAAAQNVMLAAHALGFGAMWKTGGAAHDAQVKSAFGLAPKDALVGFLYIGTEPPATVGAPAPDSWQDRVAYWR